MFERKKNISWAAYFFTIVMLITQFFILRGIVMAEETKVGKEIYDKAMTTAFNVGYPSINSKPSDVTQYIGNIISILLLLIGSLFLALMVYAGFLWMMARGESAQIEKARDIIIHAAIGITIVFSAYALTYFVVRKAGEAAGYVTGL